MWRWEAALIPTPIRQVLSTIRKHQVPALLMGGQACVFYGAAQFSKDVDLAILASEENFCRLRAALGELNAKRIAVPRFDTVKGVLPSLSGRSTCPGSPPPSERAIDE